MDETQDWIQNAIFAAQCQLERERIEADICPYCKGPGYMAHKKNANGTWKSPEIKAACDEERDTWTS